MVKIIYVILLLIILIVILLLYIISSSNSAISRPTNSNHTVVYAVNFYTYDTQLNQTSQTGASHGFNVSAGSIFSYTTTFIASCNSAITNIYTYPTNFQVLGVSPQLPITVPSGSSQSFVIKLKTPTQSYYGNLSIIQEGHCV